MKVNKSGFYNDQAAIKLLDWLCSYEDVTTAAGNVGGTTLICNGLLTETNYAGYGIKVLDTAAAGQVLTITSVVGNTVTVPGFTDSAGNPVQIPAGTRFIIFSLNLSGIVAILAGLNVPAPDSLVNLLMRDVIGNKASTPIYVPNNTADAIRYLKGIQNRKPEFALPVNATYTTITGNEETILLLATNFPRLLYLDISLSNLVAGDDFFLRVYKRVDGVNFVLKSEQEFVGLQSLQDYEIDGIYYDANVSIRVAVQRMSATNRTFPYNYNVFTPLA